MKANEDYSKAVNFMKKFGLGEAKYVLGRDRIVADVNLDDLKRLVESYELVEKAGGLKTAKLLVMSSNKLINALQQQKSTMDLAVPETISSLEKAIADVEACKEVL